ncbi:MAG: T9SS type A sorting domain-containing protein [Stygiobacter sp.]
MKTKILILFITILTAILNFQAQQIGTGLSDHTIVVNSNGTVYTWGSNGFRELGNGNNINSNVPVAVDTNGMGLLPIELDVKIPGVFSLNQNYPNPFNPSTTFDFIIPEDGLTSLKIYDLLGQEVQTIVNEELKPGAYKVSWNACGFASGIYFYTLTFRGANSNFTSTKNGLP